MNKKIAQLLLLIGSLVPIHYINARKCKKIDKLAVCRLLVKNCAVIRESLGVDGTLAVDGALTLNGVPINNLIGLAGAIGPAGATGATGPAGAPGTPGIPGIGGVLGYGFFYLLQPNDDPAPIAAGGAVIFPNDGVVPTGGITRLNGTTFQLSAIGVYEVTWQVSVDEPGQLIVALNGIEQPQTRVGRATGTSQIVGNVLIQTVSANSTLQIRNPTGNTPALTVTPSAGQAGGTPSVTGSLVIERIA